MRILLAPDKFKGTLSASAVCETLDAALRSTLPEAQIVHCPIADGGEGFAEAMNQALGGQWISASVHDALGRHFTAAYSLCGTLAVMEMSAASGIALLRPDELDPWQANTVGTGEMMRDAQRRGAQEILIGIGGSATNDAGLGMALALGYQFLDSTGQPTFNLPSGMDRIATILPPDRSSWPRIRAACDVSTLLLGEAGATRVFGPQKGVKTSDFVRFECGFARLVELAARDLGILDAHMAPGSGAAGGLGWGLLTFAGAHLEPGFDIVSRALELEAEVQAADLIITGEGKLDAQSAAGKGPVEVARLALRHGKPCLAIAGHYESEANPTDSLFCQIFSLTQLAGSSSAAMADPRRWLTATAEMATPLVIQLLRGSVGV